MQGEFDANALELINAKLAQIFEAQQIKAATIHPSYERLWEQIKRIGLAGGKRLRPRLLLRIANSLDPAAVDVAVAHELLHIATLIHDDIIDNDDIRHGKKNIVGLYKDIYADMESTVDVGHFARSAALIAGDLLLSHSHALIAESSLQPETIRTLQQLLQRSIFEVIGGQLMDTEAPFMSDYYDPLTIYTCKTASYSFVMPILSGAVLAGLDKKTTEALEQYGNALGVAFQLRDDDLGVFGDSAVTGKSTSQDLREGKKTKFVELFLERASDAAKAEFLRSFGVKTTDDATLTRLRELLVSSGARDAHEALIHDYLERSLSAVQFIDEPLKTWLIQFAHQNADRKF